MRRQVCFCLLFSAAEKPAAAINSSFHLLNELKQESRYEKWAFLILA